MLTDLTKIKVNSFVLANITHQRKLQARKRNNMNFLKLKKKKKRLAKCRPLAMLKLASVSELSIGGKGIFHDLKITVVGILSVIAQDL